MSNDCSMYRLEDLLSSFYKIESIEKINYHQYVPKKQDDQWSIQMELYLRKQSSRNLVALLSRELWCFSINDDPVPTPPKLSATGDDVTTLDKSGQFTAHYSKPNLPPHYALFLKALRRMLYINLTAKACNKLVPFGNACISLEGMKQSQILQLEPHLFENGDLAITISTKNLQLLPLTVENINESFLRRHALYLAPSGIRMYLSSSDKQCLVNPPKNAEILLKTLFISHGIELPDKNEVQWVKVIPNLNHLNGYTPNIAAYMDPPLDTRTITWPLSLCFAQTALDAKDQSDGDLSCHDLHEAFDVIDDFNQLKQTSAYRTPSSSGGALGNSLGTNPLSSGGGYTEQFQHFYKNPAWSSQSANDNVAPKISPRVSSPSYSTFDKALPGSSETFAGVAGLTTPSINENEFSDRRGLTNGFELTPVKSDVTLNLKRCLNDREPIPKTVSPSQPSDGMIEDGACSDSVVDKELFGEEEEEEDDNLFGESSQSSANPGESKSFTPGKAGTDEITEDMFGMSDDEDGSRSTTSKSGAFFLENEAELRIKPSKRSSMKRKYLDIPMEEMTLSNSPLYMDPGAPLPVETPKDRRKSVFAPLNFNPIIENNVDNKYKNGGKFSFSPSQHEESLKFDVSTADISSSEDESESSVDFDDLNIKPEAISSENNLRDAQYNLYSSIQAPLDSVPPNVNKVDLLPSNIPGTGELIKETSSGIWKINNQEMGQSDPLITSGGGSIPSAQAKNDQYSFLSRGNLTGGTNSSNLPESDSGVPETTPANVSLLPESSSSLPFLLRHMPLSSMPSVFSCSNPTVTITKNDQYILAILAEQVVFDYNIFNGFGKPQILNSGLKDCQKGLIAETIRELFSSFSRVHGNELISSLSTIKEPSIYVKKHHSMMNMSADSQVFSKFLNVKPAKGIKNFRFLMLTTSYAEDCLSFVSTLCQTYIGYEFGFCELLKLTSDDSQGLMQLPDFDKSRLLLLAAQIVTYCSTNKNAGKDVPVMILLPIECYKLEELTSKVAKFEIIHNEVTSKIPNAQIYLKVVLMDFIRSPLTSVDDYNNLCVSVYNILPPKTVKFTSIAHKLPEKVTFRTLQQSAGTAAIGYDTYIHLAYARSVDKEWVFAAFSDSSGNESLIKQWYVGTSKTRFDEACNEIWGLALHLSAKKFGKICLILTRLNGVLPDDELMNWRRLSGKAIHLAVVCVDDDTKISFFDEDKMYPTFKPLYENQELTRKVDPRRLDDYEIRDIAQDVHGVIFESCFPLTNSQHRCAIKSGALMKFKRSAGDSIVDKFEVNLLNCPHSDSTKLLETILREFRNLGALSSWFGVSNGENAHIPWHVLAVKKMMQVFVHTRVKVIE